MSTSNQEKLRLAPGSVNCLRATQSHAVNIERFRRRRSLSSLFKNATKLTVT